jgi:RNA polymerase-binding transcription factor DksA
MAAKKTAKASPKKAKAPAKKTAKASAKKVVKAPAKKAAKASAKKVVKAPAKKAAKVSVKKNVKASTKKATKAPVKKAATTSVKKKTKTPVKKAAISAKKAVKTSVKKADTKAPTKKRAKNKYTAPELKEFGDLIDEKLRIAKEQLAYYQGQISEMADNPDSKQKGLSDGVAGMESEHLYSLASRQRKHIQHLENAKLRVQNKVYGICRVTGKLISKERLMAVPHATLSIEAKM